MKDSLQLGKNQHLEPKEILRQRNGATPQSSEYLVKWSLITQTNTPSNQSDTSSTSGGKDEKSILLWMTSEEVEVCCSNLFGSGLARMSSQTSKHMPAFREEGSIDNGAAGSSLTTDTDSEDFEDMKDDVQKLVIRARRQMKTTDTGEIKPMKNISYTLKVLSTYASLGSLATVFRQTGALDLILELLWSKDVETRRHAGRMLKALASHDAGSRAYVLLSLIQDRHGQMTSSDDADFENRNTVMEMFAETSSGEEAHAVSLDSIQLPQVPGKSLFKLMKCYLKVTSLLDMDCQFGQLMTDNTENSLKKELTSAKPTSALFSDRKFEITMAITDLIYELCEVMGWTIKQTSEFTNVDIDVKPPAKVVGEPEVAISEDAKKVAMSQYKQEFSEFMDVLIEKEKTRIEESGLEEETPLQQLWTQIRRDIEVKDTMVTQLFEISMKKQKGDAVLDTDALSSEPTSQLHSLMKELRKSRNEGDSNAILDEVSHPTPTALLEPTKSRCIFSSRQKDSLDKKLLAELIQNDASLCLTSETFREPESFPMESDYKEYVRSMIRPGWYVRATANEGKVQKGDEGIYEKTILGLPETTVVVYWFRLGSIQFVKEKGIQIIGRKKDRPLNVSAKDAAKLMPDLFKNPENTKLWPVLIGQDVNKHSGHPYASGLGLSYEEGYCSRKTTAKDVLVQRQWWEVLFFIQKLTQQTQQEAFKKLQESLGNSSGKGHFSQCGISDFKDYAIDAFQIMSLIRHLAEYDPDSEMTFRKSSFCSRFLKPRDFHRKKWKEDHGGRSVVDSDNPPVAQQSAATSFSSKSNETSKNEAPSISTMSEKEQPLAASKERGPFDFSPTLTLKKPETKPDKVHDYLMGICRQSMKKTDELLTHELLVTKFKDISGRTQLFSKDTKVEEALDRLPDGERRSRDRVVGLIFLHYTLKQNLETPFTNQTLNAVLFKLQAILNEDDLDLCIAWMECIRIILDAAHTHGPGKMRGAEVVVATSGCLVGIMSVLKWFPTCFESTMIAIKCLELATRAVKFHDSMESALRAPEAQIIRTIVDSIVSAADASSAAGQEQKSELAALLDSLNFAMDEIDKLDANPETKVDWADVESCTGVGTLYQGLCICNFLITDHPELMKRMKSLIIPILKRAALRDPPESPVVKILTTLNLKLRMFSPPTDELSIFDFNERTAQGLNFATDGREQPDASNTKLETAMEELLDPDNVNKLSATMGRLLTFLCVIIYDKQMLLSSQVYRIVNTLFPTVLFPNMNLKMSATELSQCIDIIEHVLFESKPSSPSQTSVLATVLEEKHRPTAVSTLLQTVETLSAATLRANLATASQTQLKEVVIKVVSLLQRIADVDRDSAVVMCGLEAKQYLTKAIEKHDSIPKASELIEFLANYDRYRSLHSKLLVVVLGGTVGVALRCMEDARKMQSTLEIPLLERLFASLCQGSDFDVKEDKCWDKMEVSSNQRQSSKLTDGNSSTYWESNGSSGSHWINIYMKKGVLIRKLTVHISQDDSSYMPARFVVMGMTTPSSMSSQLNLVTVTTADTKITVLENEKRYWPIIRICIRRCQQGGIDTRIRAIEVVGPKPSFWPVLRQQLCVRTCLAYFIRARAWIASCTKKDDTEQPATKRRKLMNHGILKLSSRIIEAIRHEQEFADLFLPNNESSLVLGQAFRNAVINPLVSAVLDAGVSGEDSAAGTTLIFELLSLYLEMSNPSEAWSSSSEMEQLEFLSSLRRLTRLLVDLNPNGNGNIKKPKDEGGVEKWRQTMQSKSGKDEDSARTARNKDSSPNSVHSFMHDSSDPDKVKEVEATYADELIDPSAGRSWNPGLAPLGGEWRNVITVRLQQLLNRELQTGRTAKDMATLSKEGHDFCLVLAKEYQCMRSCTTELFGTSAHFLSKLMKAIHNAVVSLDVERTVMFGKNVALAIHDTLMKASNLEITQNDLQMLNHLVEFLLWASGVDLGCVLEPFYCTLLASRLLNYERTSVELEKEISSVLRACFPDGRPRLMLQDAAHSKVLWKGFTSHRMEMFDTLAMFAASEDLPIERKQSLYRMLEENWKKFMQYKNGAVNVQVLSPVAWRLRATRKNAVPDILRELKSDLLYFLKDYEAFFHSAYRRAVSPNGSSTSGPLHWSGEGWAEVVDTLSGQTYKVTTTQMLLLLHFNNDNNNKVKISSWKRAFPHHWELALNALIEANILMQTTEDFVTLQTSKVKSYRQTVHDATSSKMDEVDLLNRIDEVQHLTERRNAIIDCAIVECIKKAPCQIDTLTFNVTKHCLGEPKDRNFYAESQMQMQPDPMPSSLELPDQSTRNIFFPMSSEVRARCEFLLDMGYLKRDPENPQVIQYVPEVTPIRSRHSTVCVEKEAETQKNESPKRDNALVIEKSDDTVVSDHEVTKMDIERAITISDENIEDDDEDNWETAESSSTSSSVPAPVVKKISPTKSGAIPKTTLKKNSHTEVSSEEIFPYAELRSWHLVHGMLENPAIITLQKSCQSLTKNEIFEIISKSTRTLSEVLACDKSIIEALLLELDWKVDDLIEHYTTNRIETLQSIGVTSKKNEKAEPHEDLSDLGAASPSTSRVSSPEYCCPVCTNELELPESLALQCGHECCHECWKTYLMQKLDENQTSNTKCPVSKCEARPSLQTYETLFKGEKEKIERYQMALVRSYVESDRSLTWCHCPVGCEMVIRKGSSWSNIGTCSRCGWETCFACTYAEAHFPASCGHMSQWLEDGGYYEGMGDDARSKHLARLIAKRCPNCQANIEKDDGCLHMKCLKCSHDFCWRCLKDWRPTHRDYYKCSAKVSKLAHAGIRFQEHNKKCQFHHKAKDFPFALLRRLMTVDATSVSMVNLTHSARACLVLVKARKVLAYCNVFNYYSADTEKMKAMELHSQVLENDVLQLQDILAKTLQSFADINYCVANIKEPDRCLVEERCTKILSQLKNLHAFSTQDMKVGMPSTDLGSDGKNQEPGNSDAVLTYARPAGMSDEEQEDDVFGTWRRGSTALEEAVDRLGPVMAWGDNDDEDDDNNVDDNFPSSSEDTFSDDDGDDDDDSDDTDQRYRMDEFGADDHRRNSDVESDIFDIF